MRILPLCSLAVFLAPILLGCQGRPGRVAAPDWEPEQNAKEVMAALDKDQNGQLSGEELAAAPGLRYCAPRLDSNGDQQLSEEEVRARFQLYRDQRVGLKDFACVVTYKGRPLDNATVRLVPEPFVEAIIEPATGTTANGVAQLSVDGSKVKAVRIGMYRVEITAPGLDLPAKYNTETELGIEIAPIMDPTAEGLFPFKLQ